MVKSRKNLKKKNNKYNSKKLNQVAGGKQNLYLGYIYNQDNLTDYTNKFNFTDSNKGKNIIILFLEFWAESRNTINNGVKSIKLVEDKFSRKLLYRKDNITIQEHNFKNQQDSLYDDLKKNMFIKPLHCIKKMKDDNMHLIMYEMPNSGRDKYNLKYLNEIINKNINDSYIVLFPCLKTYKEKKGIYFLSRTYNRKRSNSFNIQDKFDEIYKLGFEKQKESFNFSNKPDYNYKYGVYTKNIKKKFDLKIIKNDLPPPTPTPTPTPTPSSPQPTPTHTPQPSPTPTPTHTPQPSSPPSSSPPSSQPSPQPSPQSVFQAAAIPVLPKTFIELKASDNKYEIIEVDDNGDCFFDSVCICLESANGDETEIKTLKESYGSINTDYAKIKNLRAAFVTFKETNDFDDFYINSLSSSNEKTQQILQRDLIVAKDRLNPNDQQKYRSNDYKTVNALQGAEILTKEDFKEYLTRTKEDFDNDNNLGGGGLFYADQNVTEFIRSELKIEIIIIEEKDGKLSLICPIDKKGDIKGFIILIFKNNHYKPIFYDNKGFFKTANDVPDLIKRLINRPINDGGCIHLPTYFRS